MTTTDPFNTADTYFDEMPHHLADYCEHAGVGKACRRCRRKFDASSQWARTHLAVEVRKAKAEALRAWASGVESQLDATTSEGIALGEWGRGLRSGIQQARDTADHIETGDQR